MQPLTTTNIIAIAATAVVSIGWFVNGAIQRRHEIAKERFRVRIAMLNDSLRFLAEIRRLESANLVAYFSANEIRTRLLRSEADFSVYGTCEEYEAWSEFYHLLKTSQFKSFTPAIESIFALLKESARIELGLEVKKIPRH